MTGAYELTRQPNSPAVVPQVYVATEQYNRLVRLVEIGGRDHGQGGLGLRLHPLSACACTAGEASMAASMMWSSTKFWLRSWASRRA